MRRKFVAGNWKMHGLKADLVQVQAISTALSDQVDVALCVPFTLIAPAVSSAGNLTIGAQDVHAAEKGAHTGCISAPMLIECGATLTIVGHSERRTDQNESDAVVKSKAETAHEAGLSVILCVGESLEDRDAGRAEAVVTTQLAASLPEGAAPTWLSIAYEPIWAIGTGRTPTEGDVAAMHGAIRAELTALLGEENAGGVRILYGGSVNGDNAEILLAAGDVDGALVGGASLSAEKFVPIIEAAVKLSR